MTGTEHNIPADSMLNQFQSLMPNRIREILLVSSLYDSFILGHDGQLNKLIVSEFLDLNLLTVPGITRVSSGASVLEKLRKEHSIDLIIMTTHLDDMHACSLASEVTLLRPEIPLILLLFDYRELRKAKENTAIDCFDKIFLWQGDFRILLGIVKYVEDKKNVKHDTEAMGVQSIILLEDDVRSYSSFLPMMYTEVMRHSQGLIESGINLAHKIIRMQARPKILLSNSYEEAMELFQLYQDNILGIVTDLQFPRDGHLDTVAGIVFARNVRESYRDIPILIQSDDERSRVLAESVNAAFSLKNSPTLLQELRSFMRENFGFGSFIFRLENGKEVGRSSDLKSLEEILRTVPDESLLYHARHNHFSKWLKARTEFELAESIRNFQLSDYTSSDELREYLIKSLRDFRKKRSQGVIEDFDRAAFDSLSSFVRIGGGSLGGKARSLAFMNMMLKGKKLVDENKVSISVPPSIILSTDIFDEFLNNNELKQFALKTDDEDLIRQRFSEGMLPDWLIGDLRYILTLIRYPLAVRSSSLLEDSHYQHFSGVYHTYMVPNNHANLDIRLRQLVLTIKMIYASTYGDIAKAYIKATPYRLEEEKMAVIIQRLIGEQHGDLFYPTFSGVAQSVNYYPTKPMKAEDGLVTVAAGFGKTVVEGKSAFRFCPRYPLQELSFSTIEERLDYSQTSFYALQLSQENPILTSEGEDLICQDIDKTLDQGVFDPLLSDFDLSREIVYNNWKKRGIPFISFAPLLKGDYFPFCALLSQLLQLFEKSVATPVQLEFASNLTNDEEGPPVFSLLQMRPLGLTEFEEEAAIVAHEKNDVLLQCDKVLGNGRRFDVHFLIWVTITELSILQTRKVTTEIEEMNQYLKRKNEKYIIIGPGRWGSADPRIGIPVTWDMISEVSIICETRSAESMIPPSQGAHFFQNLTAFNVGYFTIDEEEENNFVAWEWLNNQRPVRKSEHLRLLRFHEPFFVAMSGRAQRGVILKPKDSSEKNYST